MNIVRRASAGTMESSDVMVMVSPGTEGIEIELESSVYTQFGGQIESQIRKVVQEACVERVRIKAQDFGALDCTIRARVRTALERAAEREEL